MVIKCVVCDNFIEITNDDIAEENIDFEKSHGSGLVACINCPAWLEIEVKLVLESITLHRR